MLDVCGGQVRPESVGGRSKNVVNRIDARVGLEKLAGEIPGSVCQLDVDVDPLNLAQQISRCFLFLRPHAGENLSANDGHAAKLVSAGNRFGKKLSSPLGPPKVVDQYGGVEKDLQEFL